MAEWRAVLSELSAAEAGSKDLDAKVFQLVGQSKRTTEVIVPAGSGMEAPPLTTNLQAALDLAKEVAPGNLIGVGWEQGAASARLGDGEYITAAKPALALCIATLLYELRRLVNASRRTHTAEDLEA